MRHWFLSYNSRDIGLARAFEAALRRKDPAASVFFAPNSLRAGGYWLPELSAQIARATAFVLLIGEHGVGPWQEMEYFEAVDKRVKNPSFPVMLILTKGQQAPGLPFLRQLHWIVTDDPLSELTLASAVDGAEGSATRPRELWRHSVPYRGLAAMTEADSEFF